MSRIEYGDGFNIFWGGWAKRALGGKRGQAVFAELEQALLAMPRHRLISDDWAVGGDVCLLGSLDAYRQAQTLRISVRDAINRLQPQITLTLDESGEYPFVALTHYDRIVRVWLRDQSTHDRNQWPHGGRSISYRFGPLTDSESEVAWHEIYPLRDSKGPDEAAESLGLTRVFAWEAIERNDEAWGHLSPEARWQKALEWVRAARAQPERAYMAGR